MYIRSLSFVCIPYEIKQYTLDQAKKHGYMVKVSTNSKEKLDAFQNRYNRGLKDYPTYV